MWHLQSSAIESYVLLVSSNAQAMQAQLDAAQVQDMKTELARVKAHEGELEATLTALRESTTTEIVSLKDRLHAATMENTELRADLNK